MTEPLQNFSVPRNNDTTITVHVTSSVVNDTLVGCGIKFALYPQKFAVVDDAAVALVTKTVGSGITIPVSPPNLMEFDVTLLKADTHPLDYGNYYFEATVTDEIGNVVTVLGGIVAITFTGN